MESLAYSYDIILLAVGFIFLLLSFLRHALAQFPVSVAMVFIVIGVLLAIFIPDLPAVDPVDNGAFVERVSELAVIISLMGVGLKLDRPIGWHTWNSTWRLLAVTMPLSILALALAGFYFVNIPLAAAVLLGAVLAPTDPVLASDVQVGPPMSGDTSEEKFALTSEAGLNDGLAFPFVNLAVVLSLSGLASDALLQWFTLDVVWKIFSGVLLGGLIGHGIAVLFMRFCGNNSITDGFIAIALTLFTYGATELIHGYGFIGVFVAAVMFRRYEREHEYHQALHSFSEQMEQLIMSLMLILFGIAIGQGLLSVLSLQAVVLGLLFLFLIRPVSGILAMAGTKQTLNTRLNISWFGIRGIGTFYYLAHGLNHASIDETHARMIWAVAGFIVLLSVVLHGLTSHYMMRPSKAG
jgi:sodium/hydrogen antiporter